MTIKDFGECIEFNIANNIKHSILGLGAPGIGKSQMIQQIGAKYGYKVIDIRLSQMSEVEIGGLIYPNEDKTKTRWLTPEILPDEARDGKKTILLLDEITSCTKRVQVAAYQLILDRKIGQYTLPEGTFVIALGNREEDDGVFVRLAAPLANRFEIHEIDVDFSAWKNDYAIPHKVHPYVIKYLSFNPSALHTQKEDAEEMVFASPRSWDRVSDILKIDSDLRKEVILYKIRGNIGVAEANQFISFCRSEKARIGVDEFLEGAPAPAEPSHASMLIDGLVEKVKFIKRYKNDLELNDVQRKQLIQIIESMFRFKNNEYTIVGLKKLLDINRSVVTGIFLAVDNADVKTFIRKNKGLTA